jgi:hypothetical protein
MWIVPVGWGARVLANLQTTTFAGDNVNITLNNDLGSHETRSVHRVLVELGIPGHDAIGLNEADHARDEQAVTWRHLVQTPLRNDESPEAHPEVLRPIRGGWRRRQRHRHHDRQQESTPHDDASSTSRQNGFAVGTPPRSNQFKNQRHSGSLEFSEKITG